MAGETEEPFRFNFQADLLHSGSISFGRFESDSLSWERRSSFSHNRYLEEVEKYSKPGSVTEKKAYFEAHFKRKALLKQSSSSDQDFKESENGNEINHFTCSDESPHSSNHSKYDEETETEKLKFEQTHQSGTDNVVLAKRIIANTNPIAETKQPKPKLKTRASYVQVQRIVSSESSQAKTRESKGLLPKEIEKKSPRLVSPATHSGQKTSNKSLVKEYRSEKTTETKSQLPGPRQTINRTKQIFITGKPHVNPSAADFTFKRDQRIATRKEERRAAELIQPRKSLNFKATPMPSFYKDSARCSDQDKISTSKTPNRPRTSSTTLTTNRITAARPSSSASLTTKNRPSELSKKMNVPVKRVQGKKNDSNEPEVTKGPRARDTLRRNGPKLVST